jgi:hypothetical protein
MCVDPISLALTAAGAGASALGTSMQNSANKKAYRQNLMAEAMADQRNREIDARNNARVNEDIAKAEQIQYQALLQNAEEARVRNEVLADFTARQRQVAERNAAQLAAGAQAQGAESTKARTADAARVRSDFAGAAIDGSAPVDANFRGSTPDVVKDTLARALADSRRTARERSDASAAVSAYGDAGTTQGLGLADIIGGINLNNDAAKGDLSLLPAAQELRGSLVRTPIYAPPPTLLEANVGRPQQIAAQPSMMADVLKGFGSLAGSIAGSGRAPGMARSVSSWFGG